MGFVHCNLRVLMAEKGLNIQKVKDKTTLSRTTISNLYNNYGAGVQFDTIVQLCQLLKCQPGDLFTYVDLDVDFDDISPETTVEISTDIHITDPAEGDGFEYLSAVYTTLIIQCNLEYEGIKTVFDFTGSIKAGLDEKQNIMWLNTSDADEYEIKIRNLNLPYYAVDYINNKLDEFIYEWVHDYVSQIEF